MEATKKTGQPIALTVTPRQLEVLKYIRRCRATRGVSPTLAEIAFFLGVHKSTARDHVVGLHLAGALACTEWGSPRAMYLTPLAEDHLNGLLDEPGPACARSE